jgi:hypothetical protein
VQILKADAMKLSLLVLLLAMSISALAYGQQPKLSDPPSRIPDNCSAVTISLLGMNPGTDSYTMLNYDFAALAAGHNADQTLSSAIQALKSNKGTPTSVFTDVFGSMQVAKNQYLCAAFIAGQFEPKNADQKLSRDLTITVYNRLALLTEQMDAYIRKRLLESNTSTTTALNNADTLAQLTHDRDQAFSDLIDTTTLTAMQTIYTGDTAAAKTDTLMISASERMRLLAALDAILKDGKSDKFVEIATLMKSFMKSHDKNHA